MWRCLTNTHRLKSIRVCLWWQFINTNKSKSWRHSAAAPAALTDLDKAGQGRTSYYEPHHTCVFRKQDWQLFVLRKCNNVHMLEIARDLRKGREKQFKHWIKWLPQDKCLRFWILFILVESIICKDYIVQWGGPNLARSNSWINKK